MQDFLASLIDIYNIGAIHRDASLLLHQYHVILHQVEVSSQSCILTEKGTGCKTLQPQYLCHCLCIRTEGTYLSTGTVQEDWRR